MAKSKFDLGGSTERGEEQLRLIGESLDRKFGTHTAMSLEDAAVADVIKIPFGILDLDIKTGGGWAIGRLIQLWGPKSSLKSTMCLRAVRTAQMYCRHCKFPIVEDPETGKKDCRCPKPRFTLEKPEEFGLLTREQNVRVMYGMLPPGATLKNPVVKGKRLNKNKKVVEAPVKFVETYRCEPWRCIYVDSERTIDKKWAKRNGVNTRLVQLVGGKWAEQVLDTTEDLILTQEFDLVIIDSLSMLTTEDEIRKTHSENPKMANQAQLVTRALKKWLSAMHEGGLMSRYSPTIIGTSQVRTKGLGTQFTYQAPSGGHAQGHAWSQAFKLSAEGYEFDDSGDMAKYGTFGYYIDKEKTGGTPKVGGSFRFWLLPYGNRMIGDVEDVETVLNAARKIGLVEEKKPKLTLHSPLLKEGSVTFSRVGDMLKCLKEYPSVYADLRERVLTRYLQARERGEFATKEEERPSGGGKKKGLKKKKASKKKAAKKEEESEPNEKPKQVGFFDPLD